MGLGSFNPVLPVLPSVYAPPCGEEGEGMRAGWVSSFKRTCFLLFLTSPGIMVDHTEVNPRFDENFSPCNDLVGASYGGGG